MVRKFSSPLVQSRLEPALPNDMLLPPLALVWDVEPNDDFAREQVEEEEQRGFAKELAPEVEAEAGERYETNIRIAPINPSRKTSMIMSVIILQIPRALCRCAV